jgi:hypothetical protein
VSDLTTTRRSVLGRALGLVAAAAGGGGVAAVTAGSGTAASTSRTTMRLTARHVEIRGGEERRYAALVNEAGELVGHLVGTSLPLAAPFDTSSPVTSIELHSLELAGGDLLAHGALRGTAGTFHLTGGTGRFEHARGSYRYELGHGAALLTIDITTREGS